VAPLTALVDAGHDVVLVVSRADTRRGRGGAHQPSPVKAAALDIGIPVTDRLDELSDAGAELGVVVAYGRIVPVRLLDALDFVNIHFSLLPRWRGAAPVERAILAGDPVTGVSIMRLEEGLDTGPVLARRSLSMDDEHAGVLVDRLSHAGAELLVDLLGSGVDTLGAGEPQVGEPTYAAKLEPDELRLDWRNAAAQLHRVVRLDRAWSTFRGRRLRVLEARPGPGPGNGPAGALHDSAVTTGDGVLELVVVQPEARRPMSFDDWRRGVRPEPGELLGDDEAGR
jgi:methionyl-tRNA formyltransferase